MKIISKPKKEDWNALIKRPVISNADLYARVSPIIKAVQEEGDLAIRRFTAQFDAVDLDSVVLSKNEIHEKASLIDGTLKEAIDTAFSNIWKFHEAQHETFVPLETSKGVTCWRESRAIEKVGLYVPGGTAPLFSSLLMLGVPARIAGCRTIVVCTPPDTSGSILPAMAYTLERLEIDQVYMAGGAQAIAGMALGTESIPSVYKIFGPGNQYVSAAKNIVSQEYQVAIDLPAGPTELLLIADESAEPEFLAADILSQAEHGTDSQVVLVSTSEKLLEEVHEVLKVKLETLPRRDIAEKALSSAAGIYFETLDEAVSFSNEYAPEHLILAVQNPDSLVRDIVNAGSVFLGHLTPESFGDYASGTNHTLPTNGAARAYGGVSLESFQKKITFQKVTQTGLMGLGPQVEVMARAEGLDGHAEAVRCRLEYTNMKKELSNG
jgi:histidinol dehydrogenase